MKRVGDFTHHSGHIWKADSDYNSFENIVPLTYAQTTESDLYVYMCKDEFSGYVGLAYVGTLCKWKGYRSSINEKMPNIATTAEVKIFFLGLKDLTTFSSIKLLENP